MKGKVSAMWLLAAALGLSACGSDGTQYVPLPANAPDGLSYPDPNMFTQGIAIPTLVPTVSGTPTSYWVTPDLPAGLRLNADGTITGTPTEPRSPATYLVTAGNASGTTSFGVRITISGRFLVGGTVRGLTGTGLVLTNNGADDLAIAANGEFAFSRGIPAGSIYSVAVATQPSGQSCEVVNGRGAVANSDLKSVDVACYASSAKAQSFVDLLLELQSQVDSCAEPTPEVIATLGAPLYELPGDSPVPADCEHFVYVANETAHTLTVYARHPAAH